MVIIISEVKKKNKKNLESDTGLLPRNDYIFLKLYSEKKN